MYDPRRYQAGGSLAPEGVADESVWVWRAGHGWVERTPEPEDAEQETECEGAA